MTAGTDPLEWIPAHLPEHVRQQVLALTEESGGTETIECSEPVIRHWCEATEDSNPLYLDDEYARAQGFGGVVAPPAMNMTLSIPYRWPRDPSAQAESPLHFRLKKLLNLPVGVVVDIETEYLRATEEALEADRCTHLEPDRLVHWDDVEEGDALPTLLMPITVTRCVYLASGTRDFSPHHSNSQYAREQVNARDMFLNTPFNTGMLSRFATEWGGPASRLRKIKLQMRENVCAGDDMMIDGTIARKYAEDGDHLVEIDVQVSTQHGPSYGAKVTLALPVRS